MLALEYKPGLDNIEKENRWRKLEYKNRLLDMYAVKNKYTLKNDDLWMRKHFKVRRKLNKFLTGTAIGTNWNKATIQIGSKKQTAKKDRLIKPTKRDIIAQWKRDLEAYKIKQHRQMITILEGFKKI